ncbi:MAG: isoaspartyl peptidase/L-asparaginase [Candidatus Hodarchaeales archaeon]|jgi:beta-aspartyl-peptidase (threonine type)
MVNWAICGTRNTSEFLKIGREILETGRSSIDAVEEVIKEVERNPNDWTVGFNGFPNLMGEIELDASIMVGSTRTAGAVAGIKNYLPAISIARKVMDLTPHVLLVGEGAELFARSVGFEEIESLCDSKMKQYYINVMEGKEILEGIEGVPAKVKNFAWRFDKYLKEQQESFDFKGWYTKLSEISHGTVNVIALDQYGELCSGVSTSGLALKFPGRAGDTPVIGAGNYCNKYGAAACVGTGELAIRLGLARQTVEYLTQMGDVKKAVLHAIQDLNELNEKGVIQVLSMDKNGNIAACSNRKLEYFEASAEQPVVKPKNTILLENDSSEDND